MATQMKVGVVGGNGYVGQELLRLIAQHPVLELAALFARKSEPNDDVPIEQDPMKKAHTYSLDDFAKKVEHLDVIFMATPADLSMTLIAKIDITQKIVIDLSGAFRLSAEEFAKWYAMEHQATQVLNQFHYGLVPWGQEKTQPHHHLISNPGCYATCALLSLLPLLKNKIIAPENIFIDAKSGVSGAGKKLAENKMFCEIAAGFHPYKILQHQHIPEINKTILELTEQTCDVVLVTHLLPVIRGLSLSIYANASKRLSSDEEVEEKIHIAYQQYYQDYPLAKIHHIKCEAENVNNYLLNIKNVVGTPNIHIGYSVRDRKVFVSSCLDNLLKGAASQAIENINVILKLPVTTGLTQRYIS